MCLYFSGRHCHVVLVTHMTIRSIAHRFHVPLPKLPRIAMSAVRALVPFAVLAIAWRLGQQPAMRGAALVFTPVLIVLLFRGRQLVIPSLIAAVTLVPVALGPGTGTPFSFAIIGIASLFAFEAMRRVARRRRVLPRSESNAAWMTIIAVAVLSILTGGALWDARVAIEPNFIWVQAAQFAIIALSACAFWLSSLWLKRRWELATLSALVVAIAALQSVMFIMPAVRISTLNEVWANPAARVWLVVMPGALALFRDDWRPVQRVALFGLAVALVALPWRVAESWASGWLPSLIALVALVSLRLGRVSVIVGMAAIAPAVAGFVTVLLPRLAVDDQWSLGTRVLAWRGLFDLLDGRWALGLGLASYWHYWRGIIGSFAYFDPTQGYLHHTMDPKVNMHNNYIDMLAQMGVLGFLSLIWLIVSLYRHSFRVFRAEPSGFGHAYAAAAICGLTGMLASGMLGDWFFPFVYNIGLNGFRGSSIGWLLLGGLCVLDATRAHASESDEGQVRDRQLASDDALTTGAAADTGVPMLGRTNRF